MSFYPTTHTATKHTFSNKILSPLSIPSLPSPPPLKNGYVGLKPKCPYFANYTLQNEFFVPKITI